jgi:hypothetical protein
MYIYQNQQQMARIKVAGEQAGTTIKMYNQQVAYILYFIIAAAG